MFNKLLAIIILLSLMISCSTISMQYKTDFKSKNGKEGQFLYKKSYKIGNLKTWCIITGLFYGGACWGYLFYPSSTHKKLITTDANIKLAEQLGTSKISYNNTEAIKLSWDDISQSDTLIINNQNEIKSNPKSTSKDDLKGFLR